MFKASYSPNHKMPETVTYFKEEVIKELLHIPERKPDVEKVLDILVWPEVISYKLIETEKGLSNEGQNLSGLKLVVKVRIKEKVTYVADLCDQPVHAAHFEYVKNMFIVLPQEIDGEPTCKLLKKGKLHVIPYVEAVEFRQLGKRCIHKCIMLLVEAKK